MVVIIMVFFCSYFVGCTMKDIVVDESESVVVNDAKTIYIDASSVEVEIIPKDIKEVEVHYYGNTTTTNKNLVPKMNINNDNNEISIILKRESEIFVGVMYMNSDLRLEVFIPKTYNDNIHVINSSGDLSIEDFQLNKVDVEVSSGDIYMADVNFHDANLEASSGDIELNNIKGKTSIIATSGKVQINEMYGDLEVETSSGNITSIELTGNINASASSGDIELIDVLGELSAETTSGNINANIKEVNNDIYLKCSSGRAVLSMDNGKNMNLFAETASGNINNTFEFDKLEKDEETLKGSIGNGEYNISIITSSGNIEIK